MIFDLLTQKDNFMVQILQLINKDIPQKKSVFFFTLAEHKSQQKNIVEKKIIHLK